MIYLSLIIIYMILACMYVYLIHTKSRSISLLILIALLNQ